MTPEAPWLILAAASGLAFGSFLNVCIYRLPLGQSLWLPPSRCPKCDDRLGWYDNIPVLSWVMLGGRCRRCRAPISVQYPIVELVTAVLFAAVTAVTPAGPLLASRLVFVCLLVVLFGIDLQHQILPNVITLPGVLAGLIFSAIGPPGLASAAIGVLVGAGVLYGIAAAYYVVRREEGLGMGDVKMLAMVGAFLGWKAVLVTLVLGSFTGALVGVALIAASRGGMRLALPFGAFLAPGALAAMFVGERLIAWYAQFFP